jgi:hypothetical protein
MIAKIVSDKADRKEREMANENETEKTRGRYLSSGRYRGGPGRWMQMTILLIWDGTLLYMIAECLIAPVYGAAFIGVISVYLGYQL